MSVTDQLLENNEKYAASFDGPLPLPPAKHVAADVRQSIGRITANPFIPHRDQVRGFIFDVATGRLEEVSAQP